MKQLSLLLVLLVFVKAFAFAQAERITTIDGRKFIIHTVAEGNTLYSISKAYAVDESFIVQENQALKDGLKIGQELKIPLSRQSKTESKYAPKIQGEFLIHEVQKKETLYSLSRKYGLEIKDIVDYNPETQSGLKVGSRLKIPATKSRDTQQQYLQKANNGLQKVEKIQATHTVLPKETLYSLAKKYDVTIYDIVKANNGLKEGLKEGMVIKIPNRGTLETPVGGSGKSESNSWGVGDPNQINYGNGGNYPNIYLQEYKVAILLPFLVNEQIGKSILSNNQNALDFYQGALIALDSLRAKGLNVTVLVHDTKRDKEYVKSLLTQPQFADVNLFIGPFYRSSLEPVIDHAAKIFAHVVCPVPQSNKIIFNQPHVSKVQATDVSQAGLLGRYVAKKYPNANLIQVNKLNETKLEAKLGEVFTRTYYKYLPGAKVVAKDTLPTLLTNGYDFPDFAYKLREGQPNLIFTASSDPVFASGLLTHLKGYTNKYPIKVFALEKWLDLKEIDTKNKNDLRLTISTAHYVDFDSYTTKKYIGQFRSKYYTDPSEYGFLGFDVTYYYLLGLHENGLGFFNDFPEVKFSPTNTKFNPMRLNDNSGFENRAAFILGYTNYQLKELN